MPPPHRSPGDTEEEVAYLQHDPAVEIDVPHSVRAKRVVSGEDEPRLESDDEQRHRINDLITRRVLFSRRYQAEVQRQAEAAATAAKAAADARAAHLLLCQQQALSMQGSRFPSFSAYDDDNPEKYFGKQYAKALTFTEFPGADAKKEQTKCFEFFLDAAELPYFIQNQIDTFATGNADEIPVGARLGTRQLKPQRAAAWDDATAAHRIWHLSQHATSPDLEELAKQNIKSNNVCQGDSDLEAYIEEFSAAMKKWTSRKDPTAHGEEWVEHFEQGLNDHNQHEIPGLTQEKTLKKQARTEKRNKNLHLDWDRYIANVRDIHQKMKLMATDARSFSRAPLRPLCSR